MPEDLTIQGEQEQEAEVIFSTNEEYIAACYSAINAADCVDAEMLGKRYAQMKVRILKRCLKILDECTGELYDEIFDDRKEEED